MRGILNSILKAFISLVSIVSFIGLIVYGVLYNLVFLYVLGGVFMLFITTLLVYATDLSSGNNRPNKDD